MIGQVLLSLQAGGNDLGVVLKTMYAPRTILRIERQLPMSGPATRVEYGLVMVLQVSDSILQIPDEYKKYEFNCGEIGIEPSSGELIVFTEDITLNHPLNMVGYITNKDLLVNLTESCQFTLSRQVTDTSDSI